MSRSATGRPNGNLRRRTEPGGIGVSTLRVAVIGFGLIGRQRAEALGRIDGAALAATIDPQLSADTGTGAPHYATLSDVPADAFDAAVVAVPHDQAAPIVEAVLGSGRPVLVEKPLATTAARARSLEELSRSLPLPSFVGYNYRYLPGVRALLRRAAAGDFGRLRSVDMIVGHGGHARSAEGWKLDPARAGGGVLLDPGVHLLDLLLRLSPAVACSCVEASRGFWSTGIEEDVAATFRAEEMIAVVRASHIRWVNTFRVEVFGEDGYAITEGRGGNYGAMSLRVGRRWAWAEQGAAGQRESEEVQDLGSLNDSLHDELADVVAAWRGSELASDLHPATMEEGARVSELCERLYEQID